MTTHAAAAPESAAHEPTTHRHPGARFYLIIGGILAVITLIEVWLYGVPQLQSVLNPLLALLSATKFLMVVGFFMHLYFDTRLYSYMFGFGLFVAISVVTALWFLFGFQPLPHIDVPVQAPAGGGH